MPVDPWVPKGLAAAVGAVVAADWFAEGDRSGAAAIAVAAGFCCFDAVRSYRRSLADGQGEQESPVEQPGSPGPQPGPHPGLRGGGTTDETA